MDVQDAFDRSVDQGYQASQTWHQGETEFCCPLESINTIKRDSEMASARSHCTSMARCKRRELGGG